MKFTNTHFPTQVEVQPQHIGRLGEFLFTAMYGPPEPIPDILSEYCRDEVPEWLDVDSVQVQSRRVTDNHFYSIEQEAETLNWENDADVLVWYSGQHVDHKETEDTIPERWTVECPVEIKTGPEATTRQDQREVMRYLARNTEYQPIIVRLSIDSLPTAFSVTELEIIEG